MESFIAGLVIGFWVGMGFIIFDLKIQEWACEEKYNVYSCSNESVWKPTEGGED